MDIRKKQNRLTGKFDPLYMRHLRWLLTGVVALMLTLSLSLFVAFEQVARGIVFRDTTTLLEQTAENTADMIGTCQQITFQIINDTAVSPILSYSSATPGQTTVALNQISQYQYINKSLQSIYIYNGRSGKVYSSCSLDNMDNYVMQAEKFPDQSALELIRNYQEYPSYTALPRISGSRKCYTMIGYDSGNKNTSGSLNCAVLVNISGDWLQNLIAASDDQSEGETLVVDTSGRIISDSENFPMSTLLSDWLPAASEKILVPGGGVKTAILSSGKAGRSCLSPIPRRTIWAGSTCA